MKIHSPLHERVRILMHLNGSYTRVSLLRTEGLGAGGITWDIRTDAIPLHLRAIGTHFLVLMPSFTPDAQDSPDDIRRVIDQVEIQELPEYDSGKEDRTPNARHSEGPAMQVLQFRKDNGFALGLVLSVESVRDFLANMREVKAAILDWHTQHQNQCVFVMLTITVMDGQYDDVASELDRVYREEADLSPLLQGLQIEVALLSRGARAVKQYRLGQPVPGNRPWWKFW
jgi:hypothetical protein